MKPNSDDKTICVSNSYELPREIDKKRANSLLDFLEEPSAMFDGVETAAPMTMW